MPLHLPVTPLHVLKDSSLLGTTGMAMTLAFGADSRLLALGGPGSAVELWDAYEGKQVAALSGHAPSKLKGTVFALAFSPDGQLLASGGHDKTVRLWRATDGECVNVLTGFSGAVQRLAFHSAARVLAAADDDAVRLFDLGSGAVTPVPLPEGGINALAFSPSGSVLAVAPGGKTRRGAHPVALVDPASGQTVRTIGGDYPARALAFSPDGRVLAVTPRDGVKIELWDTASWQITRTLKVPAPVFSVHELAFSSQGVLGAAVQDRVCLWDPATEEKTVAVNLPTLRTAGVETLAFSPDGQLLATCRRASPVHVYR